jgi:ribonucleoside-diphosphate reductase alpha chain
MSDRGVAAETWAMTASGPRQMRWLVGRQHVAIVHGQPFTSTPEGVWSSGRGALIRVRTVEGYGLRLAWTQPMQLSDGSWKDAELLQPTDRLRLQHHVGILDWSAAPLEGEGNLEAASRAEYRDLVRLLALQAAVVEEQLGRQNVLLPAAGHDPAALQRMLLRLGITSAIACNGNMLEIRSTSVAALWQELEPDHPLARRLHAPVQPTGSDGVDAFIASVLSVEPDGHDALFTCSIPGVQAFDGNGFVVRNA